MLIFTFAAKGGNEIGADAPDLRQLEVGIAVSSATDYVSPSQKPETWKIGGYVFMAAGHYHFGLCNSILSFFE
jgi:hypothetical protein